MQGAILDKYEALGGPVASDLGFPLTSEVRGLAGPDSRVSTFSASDKPLIAVHHMQAHVLAHFIESSPAFPFLCLTVSGGHTQIVLCRDYLDMEVVGEAANGCPAAAVTR